VRIKVKVKPNSRSNEVIEISKDNFEVKVSVPPEKGKANKKVIELLSKHFKIPKSRIALVSGELYKEKVFEIEK
jgi:uncharacterized protein (TIGR00251 family)